MGANGHLPVVADLIVGLILKEHLMPQDSPQLPED